MVLRTLRELLGELAGAMDKMRDGHYDVAIPHVERTDEIGMMARATEGFRENFVRVKQSETERKNAEAAAERKSLLEPARRRFRGGDRQHRRRGVVGVGRADLDRHAR